MLSSVMMNDDAEALRIMDEARPILMDSLAVMTRNLIETEFSALKASALVNENRIGEITLKFEVDFTNSDILAHSVVPIPKMLKKNHSMAKFGR